MKKYLLILLCVILTFACEKDGDPNQMNEQQLLQQDLNEAERPRKVDVCHIGRIINISAKAVRSHLAHGDAIDKDGDGYFDKENECSSLIDCDDNDPEVQGSFDWAGEGIDSNGNIYNITVNMACDFSVGTVDYEYCIGSLTLISQAGNVYTYSETVTAGCLTGCSVTVELLHNGSLDFIEDCGIAGTLSGNLPPI